jgi:Tc5 transposase DNA-binding domain.
LKESELVQLGKVLCKWFTAVHSEGEPMTGPVIIKETKSFYDEMKVPDQCTFSEGTNN